MNDYKDLDFWLESYRDGFIESTTGDNDRK